MGTRGAVGFKLNDEYKVTYNHFDSYPSGLGEEVIAFINKVVEESGLDKLKANVKKLKLVTEEQNATPAQIKKYEKYSDKNVSSGDLKEYYVLLRQVQGADGLEEIYKGDLDIMIDGLEFLKDSLFCEYAYIINLDTNCVELYRGFNEKPQEDNPLPFKQTTRREDDSYYPVRYVGAVPLGRIPDNWADPLMDEDEDEDEE